MPHPEAAKYAGLQLLKLALIVMIILLQVTQDGNYSHAIPIKTVTPILLLELVFAQVLPAVVLIIAIWLARARLLTAMMILKNAELAASLATPPIKPLKTVITRIVMRIPTSWMEEGIVNPAGSPATTAHPGRLLYQMDAAHTAMEGHLLIPASIGNANLLVCRDMTLTNAAHITPGR